MRLWSIHPTMLDRQGLLAAWREGLLAQSVIVKLENGEKPAYRNHPQLSRFLASPAPLCLIGTWLTFIQEDATRRGYKFNYNKIIEPGKMFELTVTDEQLEYEFGHLQAKLEERDCAQYDRNRCMFCDSLPPHPMFVEIPGEIEKWEKVKELYVSPRTVKPVDKCIEDEIAEMVRNE